MKVAVAQEVRPPVQRIVVIDVFASKGTHILGKGLHYGARQIGE